MLDINFDVSPQEEFDLDATPTENIDIIGNIARGEQGPQGPPGPQGEPGADGTVSFDELTPAQRESLRGPQGIQGEKGDKGDTGDTGPQGIQGVQGVQGETGPQGPKGDKGDTGADGAPGAKGDTGSQGPKGDKGDTGDDGYSPAVSFAEITGGHTMTVTDKTHPTGQTINILDGQNGTDGVSPAISITDITGGHRLTITDAAHPRGVSMDIMDGPVGPAGPGLPAGGAAGQIPVKASGTDYDAAWQYPQYCRPNLLDNWYFAQIGGLPINQRGQNQYSTADAFTFDRWKLISGTVELTANGLILNGTIQQTIETAINQQYTACVLTSFDIVAASFNPSTKVFSITSDGSTVIKAAKLELGSYQTLAHNEGTDDNPNWVLNELPNFSEEYNKCLMYFERVKGQYVGFATGYSTNGTNTYVCGKVNPKVKAPSITLSGTIYLQSANHAGSDSSVSTSLASVFALPSGNFSFICQSSNMVQGEFNQAQFRDTTSYLDFSAE